ncbi:hypothetical protein [Emticicia soli]|uniref:DUF4231 domain-containing protein n=1 Tax=Emticicia soli TaxID=2027878 RepID=A0ABW5JBR6_9BACT
MKDIEKTKKPKKTDDFNHYESFHIFYQSQYDRIDKLESRRENFCNYVITISAGLCVLCLSDPEKLTTANSFIAFLFILVINVVAIIFITKTRPFIKMHQKRAERASSIAEPVFNMIKKDVEKIYSNKDYFRRDRVYSYLHGTIIFIAILFFILNLKIKICFC